MCVCVYLGIGMGGGGGGGCTHLRAGIEKSSSNMGGQPQTLLS